jgi:hypothetical protein
MAVFFRWILLVLTVTALAGLGSCGGGGDNPPPIEAHAPTASGLSYTPTTALQAAGGTIAVNASLQFSDSGGDVSAMRIACSTGADLTVPKPELSGVRSGQSATTFTLPADQVGKISFEVWLVDGQGSASNRLSGVVDVVAPPVTEHAPQISELSYTPTSVLQAAGESVVVTARVAFSDLGGDVTAMRFKSNAGTDVTVPMPSLSGLQSGTSTATFSMPIDAIGKISFATWLVDARGDASNVLSGAVDVVANVQPDAWTVLAAAPATLFGVAWDGQRYIAVGAGGTVMTAADPHSWSVQSSGVGHTLRSVASSGTRWIAVGDDGGGEAVVISSSDGSNWSVEYRAGGCQGSSCATPSQLSKVIWVGTQFVAVGQERDVAGEKLYGLVLTSPDGKTWSQRASKAIELDELEYAGERDMTSVAWSGTRLVAIGLGRPEGDPTAWVSADAETWTRATSLPEVVALFPWNDITWGNGRFVAVGWMPGSYPTGAHTPVFTSVDGMIWQTGPAVAQLPPMRAVTTGPNEYLAVGDSYRETSPNGIDWTISQATAACGNAVLWDGTHYVAVGQSICRSP